MMLTPLLLDWHSQILTMISEGKATGVYLPALGSKRLQPALDIKYDYASMPGMRWPYLPGEERHAPIISDGILYEYPRRGIDISEIACFSEVQDSQEVFGRATLKQSRDLFRLSTEALELLAAFKRGMVANGATYIDYINFRYQQLAWARWAYKTLPKMNVSAKTDAALYSFIREKLLTSNAFSDANDFIVMSLIRELFDPAHDTCDSEVPAHAYKQLMMWEKADVWGDGLKVHELDCKGPQEQTT